CQQHNLYPTF
nr:immunoglobulin light chain junction region [Macaca mulatta]